MMKIIGRIYRVLVKQYPLGAKVGGTKQMLGRITFYIGMINFGLIAVTAYHTTLAEIIIPILPWLTFPVFISIITLFLLIAMLLEYKFMLPSEIEFRNTQTYLWRSPMKKDHDAIRKKLDEITAILEKGKKK